LDFILASHQPPLSLLQLDVKPTKKAKASSPGPLPLDPLPSDCIGVVALFLSLSDVSYFESTCRTIQAVIQSVSEELFKQLAYERFSKQYMDALYAHVKAEIPWREKLKQQVVGELHPHERTDYSLDDFGIVVGMFLLDYSAYCKEEDDSGEIVTKHISIVSPIGYNRKIELLTEPSISVVFLNDSMLNDEESPFVKFLSTEQLQNLRRQKAKAIAESKGEEYEDEDQDVYVEEYEVDLDEDYPQVKSSQVILAPSIKIVNDL
jgi:hypothetical protein